MKLSKVASICLLALAGSQAALAQNEAELNEVVKAGGEITESATQSQQRIENISDQIQDNLQRFKAVNKEIDGLLVYNQQLERQVQNQMIEMDDLAASIDTVSVIERQITPLMIRMIDTLAQFVELDVPFLQEERANRIAGLREMMDHADVAVSEKFRRVMEAYQVETDYGRNIEAYTGLLEVEGQQRDVDFLRIGRVALVYQTRDGQTQGIWNQQARQWDALSGSYRSHINKALRVARKQLAPDMLMVPVTAAK